MYVSIDNAPLTYIGPSLIQGHGILATNGFKKGDIILDYRPYLDTFYKIAWEELSPYQCTHNWLLPIDDVYCMTSNESNKLHYINHSRTPNGDWRIMDYLILAHRDIPKNEEITIDYRLEYRPIRKQFADWM